jgi:hypothetical protein
MGRSKNSRNKNRPSFDRRRDSGRPDDRRRGSGGPPGAQVQPMKLQKLPPINREKVRLLS